jgi:hypothetical protein
LFWAEASHNLFRLPAAADSAEPLGVARSRDVPLIAAWVSNIVELTDMGARLMATSPFCAAASKVRVYQRAADFELPRLRLLPAPTLLLR